MGEDCCDPTSRYIHEGLRLDIGDIVDVRAEAGRIVIRPVREKVCDINSLIKAITDDNTHEAADFGPRVGNEVW